MRRGERGGGGSADTGRGPGALLGTRSALAGAAAVFASLLVACLGNPTVVRVMDGQVVPGRYIDVEAYGAFLVGALADDTGDLRDALLGYEAAAAADRRSPELWTRIGYTLCRIEANDPRAEAALHEALRLDAGYRPAVVAGGLCDDRRANQGGRREPRAGPKSVPRQVDPKEELEPEELGPARALAESGWAAGFFTIDRSKDGAEDATDGTRHALEALTLLHGDRVAAWDALAAWGLAHGDATLAVRGLIGVAKRAPGRRWSLGHAAVALAGEGYLAEARALAAALLDVSGDRSAGGEAGAPSSLPLVARLGLDGAILSHDIGRVHARSARAHVGLEIAAGRAWAGGDLGLARDLSVLTAKADPTDLEALIVYEGASGRAASRLLASAGDDPSKGAPPSSGAPVSSGPRPLSAEVALPFARDVLLSEGLAAAQRIVAFGGGVRIAPGDALLTPLAVDLATSGVLAESALPPDGRVELAARRFELPAERDVADASLDARHKLLALALLRPTDAETVSAARRLVGAMSEDPLVAAADAKVALARGEPLLPELRSRLEAFAPADPIVAAVLLDVARQSGVPAALRVARLRLAALARTTAERARSAE